MAEFIQEELVTVTIDGVELKAPRNAMLIEVADQAGIDIPRFCYHKHLSVAANCRMCMVEVEKAPKPLPACATPINEGMQVYTRSKLALDAQKGTMEFLLINHPLDCPVCDQGGECELQDVAMGYGSDVSRFTESKRVVKDKNIGPLVSTDMTRCIHCTRCVRFGKEIAGVAELGATGRGEFMEIGTYVEKSLSSELSGNVIDLCPVGALNAKPSRMKARAWEMLEHEHISPHDSFGSNLKIHSLRGEVIRVVPQEHAEINETWISDRDRFSYEGLYSEQRLKKVMHKDKGEWKQTHWSAALQALAGTFKNYQPQDIGVLISPNQSNEEIYLMQKIARALGVNNIDHRVHRVDFDDQDNDPLFPWLGQTIAELENQDVIVIVGSDLRSEQPMLAHRIRKATLRGAKVTLINPQRCEVFLDVMANHVVKPQQWLDKLLGLLSQVSKTSTQNLPQQLQLIANRQVDKELAAVASALCDSEKSCILLGGLAQQHFEYSSLRAIAYWIAKSTRSSFGYITVPSNIPGASLLGALPHRGVMGAAIANKGLNYSEMVRRPRKAYIVMGLEPEWDCVLPAQTVAALQQAEAVVSLHSFVNEQMQKYCDWLLPIGCSVESHGTKVNIEGRWQSFSNVVAAGDDVKEGWKVLRMLGVELGLQDFDYTSIDEVRNEILTQVETTTAFSNDLSSTPSIRINKYDQEAIFRVAALPIYAIDSLVRNAPALQAAQGVQEAKLMIHSQDVERLRLLEGEWIKVTQDQQSGIFKCVIDDSLIPGTVGIDRGLPRSEKLGSAYGPVTLEHVSVYEL